MKRGFFVPPDVVMGSKWDFVAWRKRALGPLRRHLNAPPIAKPVSISAGEPEQRAGYALSRISFAVPKRPHVRKRFFTGLLAVPDKVDPKRPLVIALHGHEVGHRGDAPEKLFDDHWWPEKLARAGYVVWAPPHLPYEQYKGLYKTYDHHAVWVGFLSVSFDAISRTLPKHTGIAVAGLSSGGTSAMLLMALRDDIDCGIFAGSLIPLNFLRQFYLIKGHPDNWNLSNVDSYLPYYLAIAPRPIQFQLGRKDPFYPGGKPLPPASTFFDGTDRGTLTSEVLGDFLSVQTVWQKFGAKAELYLHSGGHEFVVKPALRMLSTCTRKK